MMNSVDFPWHLIDTEALSQEPIAEESVLYVLGFAQKPSPAPVNADSLSAPRCLPIQAQLNNYPQLLKQLRIECLQVDDVLVWYRRISQLDFIGEVGSKNLADLNWLTPRVLAHEAVVAKLCEFFTFYPSRFGCLFSTAQRASDFAREHSATLRKYFEQVRGRQEWGIKFLADVDQATLMLTEEALSTNTKAGSGSNYLKFKQLQRTLRPVAIEQLDRLCDQAIRHLTERYEVVARPRSTATSPDRESLLANVALLMAGDESGELVAWCEHWNNQQSVGMCLQARLTGPWPPYSFCPSLTVVSSQQRAA